MNRTAGARQDRSIQRPKRRVFIVDDDPSVRTSLAILLSAEDYAVETFASAAEYLECVPSLAQPA